MKWLSGLFSVSGFCGNTFTFHDHSVVPLALPSSHLTSSFTFVLTSTCSCSDNCTFILLLSFSFSVLNPCLIKLFTCGVIIIIENSPHWRVGFLFTEAQTRRSLTSDVLGGQGGMIILKPCWFCFAFQFNSDSSLGVGQIQTC